MKKMYSIVLITIILFTTKAHSQIYSYGYAGYSGYGTIYYPNGYYYGQIYNGYANGTGTYYWLDGSFFYGSFYAGFYNGPGVLVTRYYGYLTGCWSNGMYTGFCQSAQRYNSDSEIEYLVSDVQNKVPANNNSNNKYTTYDPDGYKVTRIDPNTQMGKTLLGKYK